ncbi:MAG: DNA polymerase III subunit gamma/tau [Candidatus Shapirobacteria bacterium]
MTDLFWQKYRPAKIAQLDLDSARKSLSQILSRKNLPHAFLFSGPKGTGKTSAARVLAKSLNCLKSKKGEPCGQCAICLEINRGESLDVLEIDAASNRGIDDIRLLKEKINLQPLRAKNKVYIVDEVHMLTTEAFNAVLKTLEEPPEHVYFVFCTTNPEKIPQTVLSRLTNISFQRASLEEIISSLKRVISGEKLKVEKGALELIASSADGSFRDAHKILQQLFLENKNKVSLKAAQKLLAGWQEATPEYLLKLIGQKKIKSSIILFEKLSQKGIDVQDYGKKILQILQSLLMLKVGAKKGEDCLLSLAELFSLSEIVRLSEIFGQAAIRAKNLSLPWLSFQLAVIDFLPRKTDRLGPDDQKEPVKKEIKKTEPLKDEQKINKKTSLGLEAFKENWAKFLEMVKPLNHSVCALLRSARPKKIDENYLTLEVFYQFHKDQLEQERNRRIVEEAVAKLFQTSLKLKCELGQRSTGSSSLPASQAPKMNDDSGNNNGEDLYKMAKDIFGE